MQDPTGPTEAFGLDLSRITVLEQPTQTGPCLTYTSGPDQHGTVTTVNVDRAAPSDRRERAICRALLVHALQLLDEANSIPDDMQPIPVCGTGD